MKVTSNSMSCRIECQTEQYFSRDSWMARADRLIGNAAGDREVKRDVAESPRLLGHPLSGQIGAQSAEIVASFAQHMDNVHRHAAGEREGQSLHRGRPLMRRAVEGQADVTGLSAEHEVVFPDQFDCSGRL